MSDPVVVQGQAIGSDIAVPDSTALAALNTQGLALGTTAYNISTGTSFVLTASTASLVTDQVVAVSGITGQRWIVQTLSFPVATPTSAGLMSAAQAASLVPIPAGAFPLTMFITSTIDLTAVQNIALPTLPGYLFSPTSVSLYTMTKAGSISTSFTANAGNDASKINVFGSQTPATTFFSGVSTPPQLSGALTAAGGSAPALVDLTTPVTIQITAGATGTGGFAWTGKIRIYGSVFPAS